MVHPKLSNQEYLDRFLNGSMTAEPVLLPHEVTLVDDAVRLQENIYKGVINDKQSVAGGDDWHDGAFRETDRAALVVNANMVALAPFIGAVVIEYPTDEEDRVTLGSRVQVVQNGDEYYVELVGFLAGIPSGVSDPETGEDIVGTTPQMPLGGAVMGRRAGESLSFPHNDRLIKMTVGMVDQRSLRNRTMITHANEVTEEDI